MEGMAIANLWYVDTGMRPDPEYLAKAEGAAGKALGIDPAQPDALYVMANLKMSVAQSRRPSTATVRFSVWIRIMATRA